MASLPFDILREIFSHLSIHTLEKFSYRSTLGPKIQAAIDSVLYRRIFFGPRNPMDLYKVPIDDLEHLARSKERCPVLYLEINFGSEYVGLTDHYMLALQLVRFIDRFPDFLPRVRNLRFVGCERMYDACSLWALKNVSDLKLELQQSYPMIFPKDIRTLSLNFGKDPYRYTSWPELLLELELLNIDPLNIKLPKSLKSFSFLGGQGRFFDSSPSNVMDHTGRPEISLDIVPCQIRNLAIKDSKVKDIELILRFQNLQCLSLCNAGVISIAHVDLPNQLQLLDLLCNRPLNLGQKKLPPLLERVILSFCNLENFDIRCLPHVVYLELTSVLFCRLPTIWRTFLPWPKSIRELKAGGTSAIDWNKCGLPPTLTDLEICLREAPTFRFPSTLRCLAVQGREYVSLASLTFSENLKQLTLICGESTKLQNLRFPVSLEGLKIKFPFDPRKGDEEGEWELPNLQLLVIANKYSPSLRLNPDEQEYLLSRCPPLKSDEFLFWRDPSPVGSPTRRSCDGLSICRRSKGNMVTIPSEVDTIVRVPHVHWQRWAGTI